MTPRPELDTFYYHDHFMEMLGFVTEVYAHCLNEDERGFIARFRNLPLPAQCLFIRMVNRKAEIFSQSNLDYDEIDCLGDVIDILKAEGFAKTVEPDDYVACLLSLQKPSLLAMAERENIPDVKKSWNKYRIAQHISSSLPFETIFGTENNFIRASYLDHTDYLLYLFFGKTSQGLINFTLRDLGVVRVKEGGDFMSRFADEDEARQSYFYLRLTKEYRRADHTAMVAFAGRAKAWPRPASRFATAKRDDALFELGRYFERRKALDIALGAFELGSSGECREKVVRLAYAGGDVGRAAALLEGMINDPASDDEHTFASDFYARKFDKQRVGTHTKLLRDARTVYVDDIYRGSAELAMIDHFEKDGWTAFHTENGLWTALFTLIFWEQLFETSFSKTGQFDRYPSVLRHNKFGALFENEIGVVLKRLHRGDANLIIAEALKRNARKSNALFYWSEDLPSFLNMMITAMPAPALAIIIEKMALDFERMSDGFPDLTLVRDGQIKFVEVKAEGDQIQRHQLTRIRQLQQAGFDVEICRVGYKVDPHQTFVVVDLETTGGRAGYERITEIGAVKIRDGEVIAEWQSLINPEKHIPAFITGITGITNEMVKDAPKFSEVAAELQSFLHGSIFAAHNVNFDYGFLAAEYRRLEQRFRYPKICTVASMRKYFPGHGSYSLAAMTREYGISLKSHHRALCDAQAAAQLLILVNERRSHADAETVKEPAPRAFKRAKGAA